MSTRLEERVRAVRVEVGRELYVRAREARDEAVPAAPPGAAWRKRLESG